MALQKASDLSQSIYALTLCMQGPQILRPESRRQVGIGSSIYIDFIMKENAAA